MDSFSNFYLQLYEKGLEITDLPFETYNKLFPLAFISALYIRYLEEKASD